LHFGRTILYICGQNSSNNTMKKLGFLFILILGLSFSAKPQKQQTLNVFYGYPYYSFGDNFYSYPFNYSFGIQYGFALNEKFKLHIGCSFNTRNYFYVEYPHDPYNGTTKLTLETHINVLKLPIFHLSYNLFELNHRNKVSLFSGLELSSIRKANRLYTNETLSGVVLSETKNEYYRSQYKQTGINTMLGLSYYSTLFEWLQLRLDFCLLYNLRNDSSIKGSGSVEFHHPRFIFEPKMGIGFIINNE
jgi:hypothetical protein